MKKIIRVCKKCNNEFEANSSQSNKCSVCKSLEKELLKTERQKEKEELEALKKEKHFCMCGCNSEISWDKHKLGIKFLKGHARKNKSNSSEHNKAISKANKGKSFNRTSSWSKGLTKNTDIRLLNFSNKISKIAKEMNFGKWMIGKKPSKDTIEKIKKTRRKNANLQGFYHSEETKSKISKANSGKNNGFYEKHHSKEAKEKISVASSIQTQKIDKDKRKFYKTGFFYSNKTKMTYKFRSNLELQVFTNLERFFDVNKFYVEPIRIPYFKDFIRNYIPDVLVFLKNECILAEIKPKKFHDEAKNKTKFEAAKVFCDSLKISFAIIDENCANKMKFVENCNEIFHCFNFLCRHLEETNVFYYSKTA